MSYKRVGRGSGSGSGNPPESAESAEVKMASVLEYGDPVGSVSVDVYSNNVYIVSDNDNRVYAHAGPAFWRSFHMVGGTFSVMVVPDATAGDMEEIMQIWQVTKKLTE